MKKPHKNNKIKIQQDKNNPKIKIKIYVVFVIVYLRKIDIMYVKNVNKKLILNV